MKKTLISSQVCVLTDLVAVVEELDYAPGVLAVVFHGDHPHDVGRVLSTCIEQNIVGEKKVKSFYLESMRIYRRELGQPRPSPLPLSGGPSC